VLVVSSVVVEVQNTCIADFMGKVMAMGLWGGFLRHARAMQIFGQMRYKWYLTSGLAEKAEG